MPIYVYILIAFALAAIGYGCWWLYNKISTICLLIYDLRTSKHNQLQTNIQKVMSLVNLHKDDLNASISETEWTIKRHISTENKAIKQMIMVQFSNHTAHLIDDAKKNQQSLSDLINVLSIFLKQMKSDITDNSKKIQDNSNKIGTLGNTVEKSITSSSNNTISQLNNGFKNLISKQEPHANEVTTGINTIIRNINDFNRLIKQHLQILEASEINNTNRIDTSITALTSTLNKHLDSIATKCIQVIDSERNLHQGTQISFNGLKDTLTQYVSQLRQFDNMFDNLKNLYTKILEEEEKIANQESSLTTMVARHSQILEMTSQLNNTSNEIFEFMKLYLIQFTLDNFKQELS